MVLRPDKDQIPDIRRLQLQISQMYENLNGTQGVWATINSQGQTIYSLLNTRFNTPASPVANLLWNGEIGHSAHTWNDASDPASPTTKNEEAAWWYSHQTPAALQTFVAAAVGTNTIDLPNHGLATACAVDFTTTTTLPTGLSAGVVYFVIVIDADTISVATSMSNAFAGTATPITAGTGTGTQTIQTILIATYSTSVPTQQNQELKTIDHTTYYPQFSRWNSTNGWAELTGTTTVDQPLPMNFIDATVGLARVSMIAAKANSFIEIPDEARLTVGLFDNTSGQRQFLQGSIGLAASFNGVPDPGGDERRFRVLLTSDRGYQLLSDEVVVYNTPTVLDAQTQPARPIHLMAAGVSSFSIHRLNNFTQSSAIARPLNTASTAKTCMGIMSLATVNGARRANRPATHERLGGLPRTALLKASRTGPIRSALTLTPFIRG